MDGWLNLKTGTWRNLAGFEQQLQSGASDEDFGCPLCARNHLFERLASIKGHDVSGCGRGHRFAELPVESASSTGITDDGSA